MNNRILALQLDCNVRLKQLIYVNLTTNFYFLHTFVLSSFHANWKKQTTVYIQLAKQSSPHEGYRNPEKSYILTRNASLFTGTIIQTIILPVRCYETTQRQGRNACKNVGCKWPDKNIMSLQMTTFSLEMKYDYQLNSILSRSEERIGFEGVELTYPI